MANVQIGGLQVDWLVQWVLKDGGLNDWYQKSDLDLETFVNTYYKEIENVALTRLAA